MKISARHLIFSVLLASASAMAQTPDFDKMDRGSSNKAILEELGLDPRGVPERIKYELVRKQIIRGPNSKREETIRVQLEIVRSPWKASWGKPALVKIHVLDRQLICASQEIRGFISCSNGGAVTAGEMDLGLPRRIGDNESYRLAEDGLWQGSSFFPFESGTMKDSAGPAIEKLAQFLALQHPDAQFELSFRP